MFIVNICGVTLLIAGIVALAWWPTLFLFGLLGGVLSAPYVWSVLQQKPRLQIQGLSPPAAALLARYNHAWTSPFLTKIASFLLSVSQTLCMAAIIAFGLRASGLEFFSSLAGLFLFTYYTAKINPAGYIANHHLDHAQDEIDKRTAFRYWP